MKKGIITVQQVAQAIRFVRGERVLLDFDLARLYCVTHRQSKQSRQAQPRAVSNGLHVSTHRRGDKIFDIPIWNIKRTGLTAPFSPRFHRAERRHVVERPE